MSKPPGSRRSTCALGVAALLSGSAYVGNSLRAQVIPDRTLRDPPARLVGPDYIINQSAGRVHGQNLFHSFSKFDLSKGESATFTAEQPLSNVLVRVTGPGASNINGPIILDRATLPQANFYFMNPSGVIFGPEGSIDVPGSFAVVTANYLALGKGGRFDATRPEDSVLTCAAPAAFGFLGSRAAIELHGSRTAPALVVAGGKSLSIVAGRIHIDSRRLNASQGKISVIARGMSGEVPLDPVDQSPLASAQPESTAGPIELTHAELSAVSGGQIVLRGGRIQFERQTVLNVSTEDEPGGLIDMASASQIILNDSRLDSSTGGDGTGGSIRLRAGQISVSGFDDSIDGLRASVTANTNRDVVADPGSGRGGNILIETGTLSLLRGALVSSLVGGDADGGDIDVVASHLVLIDTQGSDEATGITVETIKRSDGDTSGNAGRISLSSPRLEIFQEGRIASSSSTAGNAGNIIVDAGSLLIDGRDARLFTGIDARVGDAEFVTNATGRGGNIFVQAGSIDLRRGGVITVSTFAPGNAGRLTIHAGDMRLAGSANSEFTGMFARAALPTIADAGDASRLGSGGEVEVHARTLSIDGPSAISAISQGGVGAGNVLIDVAGDVLIARGGAVTVAAAQTNGGSIQMSSGRAISLLDKSTISAAAGIDGGNITLIAPDLVRVDRSTITGQAGGNGGQITIDPTFVVLSNSTINGRALGLDVQVRIDPSAILLSSNSTIDSDSVEAPDPLDISGQLVQLQTTTRDRGASLLQACVARFGKDLSSFVILGSRGLPLDPATPLPSFDKSRDATEDQ